MSILDTPVVNELTPAQRQANQIKQQARTTFQSMVTAFNQGAKQFWRNPQASPSQIAAALGTDAVEVFQLHAKLGALIAEVRPEAIQEGAAMVGQFTYNADGTVTITPPPAPAIPPSVQPTPPTA
jgi:hypothetical protein